MANMWAGRFRKQLEKKVNDFNSSVSFDQAMYREDVEGSIAHATMLASVGIIPQTDADLIVKTLSEIVADIDSGALEIDQTAEDIHMFIEAELTARIGDAGKRLHTARSRNDQVALDVRMYLKNRIAEIRAAINALLKVLCDMAEKHAQTIMPGYTHLQRAQPVTFGHHLMAYAAMFMRDDGRLADCYKRMNVLPLGSCALAGTTYPVDRHHVARLLGFDDVCFNSMDGVSDRDFVIELAAAIATMMMHLSRFSEEVIAWCSWEFKYLELDDAYSTGSSIMPQKKNPDIAELVRGKTGRAYGNLMTILTVMKGIPLAYNKDMQEDKQCIFDSVQTALDCLPIFTDMLKTATVLEQKMARAAEKGFINATDVADYLTKKGVPFRTAYKITGELVAECIDKNCTLGNLPLDCYKARSAEFDSDVYAAIDMKNCVQKRTSYGGPAYQSVMQQIAICRAFTEKQ